WVFPKFSPKGLGKEKGPTALFAVSPFVTRCRRQDLNRHCLNGNQALNLARLPRAELSSAMYRQRGRTDERPEQPRVAAGGFRVGCACKLPSWRARAQRNARR